MSDALDGRIRKLAREEAAALSATQTAGPQGAGELQQQITDLHEHLHHAATTIKRLEERVDMLEKAAGKTDQEQQRPTVRRAARKDTGD